MNWETLGNRLKKEIRGVVKVREPLKNHTTWRVGGPADLLIIPQDSNDLQLCVQFSHTYSLPLTIMGNGSNLLVRDGGVRGIVIKTRGGLQRQLFQGELVRVEAGAFLPFLAKAAASQNLSGLEFTVGIPATVGGAVVMNAGTDDGVMAGVIQEVIVLRPDGRQISKKKEDLTFGYRTSSLKNHADIVVAVVLALVSDNGREVLARMRLNWERRRAKQPLNFPNAGSVFINPGGYAAGWLIEQVGAKGLRSGGIMVSEKHANFFVNVGGGTAADILNLITEVRNLVWQRFGVKLETEIQQIGEELCGYQEGWEGGRV